ncbi:hypothetical protein CHARACLAT_032850, partial [Characodon lateralis]|nr:hypothetical protein [Characodon lateralis]
MMLLDAPQTSLLYQQPRVEADWFLWEIPSWWWSSSTCRVGLPRIRVQNPDVNQKRARDNVLLGCTELGPRTDMDNECRTLSLSLLLPENLAQSFYQWFGSEKVLKPRYIHILLLISFCLFIKHPAGFSRLTRFKTWPSAAVEVKNEPILGFQKGSPERAELQKALDSLKGKTEEIPCVVGDEHVWTKDLRYQLS